LFGKYTLQELLDELDMIERFEQPGKKERIGEVTKKQQELYESLGVDAPTQG
ncbi:MAG: transposase, partial [Chloroflexi bacterium]|nr:transposase [Chloroflexota bacterium]MCX6055654.1 transposase [Chloroflexota bacterium]